MRHGNCCILCSGKAALWTINLSGYFSTLVECLPQNSAQIQEYRAFVKWESQKLAVDSFDVVYCHFVLHDISKDELERVIPLLAEVLKPVGVLVFREPLNEVKKMES